MASLEGVRRKVDWADEHFGLIENQVREFLKAETRRISEEPNFETGQQVRKLIDPPKPPRDLSLLIGDYVYNLRAALDYLAWQLARLNRPAHEPPKQTHFPIYVKKTQRARQDFKNAVRGLHPSHRRVIANEQPFKRGDLAEQQPLWILNRLRNLDSHRQVHTFTVDIDRLAEVETTVQSVEIVPEREPSPGETREQYVVGLTLGVRSEEQGEFPLAIAFDEAGEPFHLQEVVPLLERVRADVDRVIGLFSPSF